MKLRMILSTLALVGAVQLGAASTATADEAKNLKVLKDTGKDLEKGMKDFSKGLGVKCTACHEKGKFESDNVAAKEPTRTFLTKVVGEKDEGKRNAALAELLGALKEKEAKEPAKIWSGVGLFQKK